MQITFLECDRQPKPSSVKVLLAILLKERAYNTMLSGKYSVLLNCFLFLLLGSSIVLNFLLFNQAKRCYLELNETRLDPVGLSYSFKESESSANADVTRVVFFGDSRAANWSFPELDGYAFINRGIPAQTSIQSVQRFVAHVQPNHPDIVVIQVGINDLKTLGLFPERQSAIIANTKTNIQQLVKESQELGAVVIVTTIFPTGTVPLERRPFWSDRIGESIQEVNAYIQTLADEQVIVFDTFTILADNHGTLLPEYQADELHLTSEGYAHLNEELIQLIHAIDSTNVSSSQPEQ